MRFSAAKPEDSDIINIGEVKFTHSEVYEVIESFYTQVAGDEMLSLPFQSVKAWPHHIDRLAHFWWVRLGGKPYLDTTYNPPLKHFEAGFNRSFLERWLLLFGRTLQARLTQEQAQLWFSIAQRMGEALDRKNEYLKKNLGDPSAKPSSTQST